MSVLSDLVDRARYAIEHGNSDELHRDLLEQVEFLESEFENERDRANTHFDARVTAETKLRDQRVRLKAFGRDCVLNGDMTPGAEYALGLILDNASLT